MNFTSGDRILLVGEGNFSFSLALVNSRAVSDCSVISTCYQRYRELDRSIRETCWKVYKAGADLWFGVDATRLHLHAHLSQLSYDAVIFNFPHIGGKMKIHLNRQLLRDFFTSCKDVLSATGRVYVTLCKGQGGTPLDEYRELNDSWQAVQMASYGDFVLVNLLPFTSAVWPEYHCVGYRSLLKGFHTKNALTHVFQKRPNPSRQAEPEFIPSDSHCVFVGSRLGLEPNLENVGSLLAGIFGVRFAISPQRRHICLCPEFQDKDSWKLQRVFQDFFSGGGNFEEYQWSQAVLCQPCCSENAATPVTAIVYGLVLNEPKLAEPFSSEIEEIQETLEDGELRLRHYRSKWTPNTKLMTFFELNHAIDSHRQGFILYVDAMNSLCHFPCSLDRISVGVSLFPPLYSHDLSFWLTDKFCPKLFYCAVRCVAGDVVRSVVLVDSYECEKVKRRSNCYRLTYQDLTCALSPTRVWHMHYDVIGRFLCKTFAVTLR